MSENTTLVRGLPYPNEIGAVKSGATNLKELAKRLELSPQRPDFVQAGVVVATDWAFTANINSATCGVGSTATTGGAAWLPDPVVSGDLVRTQATVASLSGLVPASKPATGKYSTIGIEIGTNSEGLVTASAVGGAEGNEAFALANSPSTTAGKVRIRDVLVLNTAGVYSIVKQFDRRPWARGAFWMGQSTAGQRVITATTPTVIDATSLQARIECSGAPLIIDWCGSGQSGSSTFATLSICVLLDGAAVASGPVFIEQAALCDISGSAVVIPAAGSHLISLGASRAVSNASVQATATTPLMMKVRESISASANNGTS